MSHRKLAPHAILRDQRGGALPIVLGLVVVAVVGLAVWYFAFRTSGGSSPSAALAKRVIPADCDVIGGLNVASLLNDLDYEKLGNGASKSKVEAMLKQQGLALDDIQAVSFGVRMTGIVAKEAVVAIQSKADAKTLVQLIKMGAIALPEEVKGLLNPDAVEALDGGIFLMGSGELLARAKAISGGGGQGDAKDEAKRLIDALDLGATAWVVGPMPLDELPGGMMTEMAMKTMGLGKPSHLGLSVKIGGKIDAVVAAHIPGGDAGKVIEGLKSAREKFGGGAPEDIKKLLDGIEFGGSGPVITARLSVSPDTVKGLGSALD